MRGVLLVLLLAACRPPGYGQDDPPDAAAAADAAMASPDAAPDASPAVCDQTFRLEGYATASSVWLTGTFVHWAGDPASGAIALSLDGDGVWTGSYQFQPGAHQYKFIVDGSEWILDPANPDVVDDGLGHTNNLYTCAP